MTVEEYHSKIHSVIQETARMSVQFTLTELGYRVKNKDLWISQAEACRILGRTRYERLVREGKIRWRKPDSNNIRGRVYVLKADVEAFFTKPSF